VLVDKLLYEHTKRVYDDTLIIPRKRRCPDDCEDESAKKTRIQ
jgi:hypothetical protein